MSSNTLTFNKAPKEAVSNVGFQTKLQFNYQETNSEDKKSDYDDFLKRSSAESDYKQKIIDMLTGFIKWEKKMTPEDNFYNSLSPEEKTYYNGLRKEEKEWYLEFGTTEVGKKILDSLESSIKTAESNISKIKSSSKEIKEIKERVSYANKILKETNEDVELMNEELDIFDL